jgi:hypothetical protein
MELGKTFKSNLHTINNKLKALFQLQVVVHQVLPLVLTRLLHLQYHTKFRVVITLALSMSF